jgi:hypothetical protein
MDVCFGSKAEIGARPINVRVTPKADMDRHRCDVRFVPKADMLYSITSSALMARVCAK